eukprot:SAG25_NODE_2392_length_1655_cov_144.045630_2_plen_186_part_00
MASQKGLAPQLGTRANRVVVVIVATEDSRAAGALAPEPTGTTSVYRDASARNRKRGGKGRREKKEAARAGAGGVSQKARLAAVLAGGAEAAREQIIETASEARWRRVSATLMAEVEAMLLDAACGDLSTATVVSIVLAPDAPARKLMRDISMQWLRWAGHGRVAELLAAAAAEIYSFESCSNITA